MQARADFSNTPQSIHAARVFIRTLLAAEEAAPILDDTVLLASELVTNAVLHGEGRISVTVEVVHSHARIEVTDASPDLPRLAEAIRPLVTGGRGLRLVDSISDRWGVDVRQPGKTVWFELDLVASLTPVVSGALAAS